MASSTQRYLNSQPASRDDQLAQRKVLRDLEDDGVAALGPIDERLEELYIEIPVRDGSGWHSTCKIIRPRAPPKNNQKRALIVMLHGGGFVRGSPEMFTRPGREFALAYDAVVVSVEYRLAPEYRWPTCVLDVWDVCAHLTEAALTGNDEIFGKNTIIDDSGFVLGGASAGANIACAITSMSLIMNSSSSNSNASPDQEIDAKWKRGPLGIPISGIYLGVPFLITDEAIPLRYKHAFTSRQTNAQESALANEVLQLYQPDQKSPLFSPVNLPREALSRWPPRTYFQVGDQDIWRDDALIVKAVLEEEEEEEGDNAVQVRIDQYFTLAHVTWSVFTTGEDMDVSSELGRNTMAAMAWLLRRDFRSKEQ